MTGAGGQLFVVATPIGNLEDVTLRALRVLGEAELVLAEDTRRTKTLLAHYDIGTPLKTFHAHTPDHEVHGWVERLKGGADLALVSDAGTPLVSDPGVRLVQAAAEADVRIVPIPGASAALAALTASGLSFYRFRFVGFLPRSGRRRRDALRSVADSTEPTVLFEAPNRLRRTLEDLRETCGDERHAAVARELTKVHEEVRRAALGELRAALPEHVRGEVTVVIDAAPEEATEPWTAEELAERARELLDEGLSTKDAAKRLAAESGLANRDAYRTVLDAGER